MTILNKLQTGKFKGVIFLWTSSNLSGGRKTVTHEFPNKNIRFTEDLGLLPKSFTIEATISNINYIQNRDALISALESEGAGELTHPTFGNLKVQVTTYTLNETISDLGNAKFSITFERTEENVFPEKVKDNTTNITNTSQILLAKTEENISEQYISPSNNFANFNDAKNKVLNFIGKIEDSVKKQKILINKINDYADIITTFRNDINTIIVAPAQLAASINNLFAESQTIFDIPQNTYNFYINLFGFGEDDIAFDVITNERKIRKQNRIVLNQNIETNSLLAAYQSVINLKFYTTKDIDDVRDVLESQFQKLFNNEKIDFDTKELLESLRNEVEIYFEQQEQIAARIEIFKIFNEPITPLVYRFYGELNNIEKVINLNNLENYSFIEGNIKLLVEAV